MASRRRRLRMLAGSLLGLALITLGGAATSRIARAASPSPPASEQPTTEPPATDFSLQVWLDRAIPPGLEVGGNLEIGLTVWDPRAGEMLEFGGMFVRLKPATGTAPPSEREAQPDGQVPGHLVARLPVPEGGGGEVEVGFRGQSCDASGACTTTDSLLPITGVGPPPDASPVDLFRAVIRPPDDPLVAGVAADVEVDLVPRVDWEPSTLHLPSQLLLIARQPQGPDLANVPLVRGTAAGTPYTGQLPVRDAGEVSLEVDLPADNGADEVFPGSMLRVIVFPSNDPAVAPADGPGEGGPPIMLIVGGLAALAAASLVIRRVFADL
jgi:hypothetical protein